MYNHIAIVIPAYNEASTLQPIIAQACHHTPHVIIVDDGSTDNSIEIAKTFPVHLICHEKNGGKSRSLKDGFEKALSLPEITAVISIDADGQHDPKDISKLVNAFEKNNNALVIAARLQNTENAPRYRLFANKTADYFISKAAGAKIIDSQSGYRLYPRRLLEVVLPQIQQYDAFTFESEILIVAAENGFNIEVVPIKSHYPKDLRPSRFHPIKDTLKVSALIIRKLFSKRRVK